MTPTTTNPLLERYERMQKLRKSAFAILNKYPDRQYEQPTQSWSMAQVMHHLHMTESGSLAYMVKKLPAAGTLAPSTFKAKILLRLLFLTYFFKMKFKAPEVVAHPPNTDTAALESQWEETGEAFKQFLEQHGGSLGNRAIFRHPFVGRLGLAETLHFLEGHLKHHLGQIRRIEKQLGRGAKAN
jgi:uncharacterized damage-inducible protein DinB